MTEQCTEQVNPIFDIPAFMPLVVNDSVSLRPYGLVDDTNEYRQLVLQDIEHLSVHLDFVHKYDEIYAQLIDDRLRDMMPTNDAYEYRLIAASGEIAGSVGLVKDTHDSKQAELGYYRFSAYRGQNLVTPAAQKVVDHGFTYMNIDKIILRIRSDNSASQRVARGIGARPTDTFAVNVAQPSKPFRIWEILA